MRSRAGVAAVALLAVSLLPACSGSDDEPEPQEPTTSSEPSSSSTLLGPGSEIEDDPSARGDVEVVGCRPVGAKGWRLRLAVMNSGEEAARYVVGVRVSRDADSAVVGRKEVRTGVVDPWKRSTVKTLISREDTAKAVTCVVVAAERATD